MQVRLRWRLMLKTVTSRRDKELPELVDELVRRGRRAGAQGALGRVPGRIQALKPGASSE